MKTIPITTFGGGMVNDLHTGNKSNFSIAKNFDTIMYPNRLFPLPSMQAATSGTGVRNMIVGNDGVIYGLGIESASGTASTIWKTTSLSTTWTELTNDAGTGIDTSSLLVQYPENDTTKDLLYSIPTGIRMVESGNISTGSTHSLTHTTMSQGFIHPKDNIMYFGYQTTTATYIGLNNAGAWIDTALQLPKKYQVTSLTNYGNYLAIACTSFASGVIPGSNSNTSVVFLWDRDTSLATVAEVVNWGDNSLQVINNLDGMLVGISKKESATAAGLVIKGYTGGEPFVLKKIFATTTSTTVTINSLVNFIHNEKLYFSVDIPGSSDSPVYKGLWSFGKPIGGSYAVTLERFATTDGSNASVLSAVFALDYLHCVHTAAGTLTTQFAGNTPTTDYGTASVYESIINPDMADLDYIQDKQLYAVYATYYPLTAGQTVTFKYRVDAALNGTWINVFTETATGETKTEMVIALSGDQFTSGQNFEFRLESTGRAQITSFGYRFGPLQSNT